MADHALEVVLRTPWRGPWRRFHGPSRVIVAHEADGVRSALAEVDDEVRSGSYAAGFIGYEAAAAAGLPTRTWPGDLPLVCFGLYPAAHVESLRHFPSSGHWRASAWQPSIDQEAYREAIAAIKAHIERGDTYQINFTFRLTTAFSGSTTALMADLHAGQGGEWSGYIDLGSHVICSASPESFLTLRDQRIECRPMKGTAPRGYWPAQDAALGAALQASEKNRAENVMIVDMVRNDVGRIAQTGSVEVVSLFDVHRFPLQWQMTSTVRAQLEEPSLLAIFDAMFPSASITGAPKHRSMEIIRALETTPRGVYTGAVGYLSPRGRAHFSVAIRTVVIDTRSRAAEMGIGSGVVWDSVDTAEYEECLLKAGPLVSASFQRQRAAYVVSDPPDFRLLETLLWTPDDGFVLLEAHLARLQASAACFGFPVDPAVVRTMLENAARDLSVPAKVRLMADAHGSVLCEAVDLVALNSPMRVAFAPAAIDRHDVFLYHKTTRRAVYEAARAARPDVDAVILWNEDDEVTEATEMNLVIERDGRRITPPVACGLLPGTLRAELLAQGEIVEERITRDELRRAERVWLINSVRGWIEAQLVP